MAKIERDVLIFRICIAIIVLVAIAGFYFSFSGANDKAPDIQSLTVFHRKYLQIAKPLNAALLTFNNNLQVDAQNQDLYSMYDDAKNMNAIAQNASYQITNQLNIPAFSNPKVQQYVQTAYDSLNSRVNAILDMSKNIMNLANNAGSPRAVSAAKDGIYQDLAAEEESGMKEASSFAQAYSSLGYSISQIDAKNGGLMQNANQ